MITVDIVSDVICPWCYVAKQRLEKARYALDRNLAVQVRWLPFELNPDMPKDGIDRRTYRTRKFGSWEQSQALDARLVEVGKQEGIAFAFDRMERTPNTFDAHRLIRIAQQEGRQDEIVEGLFRGYFIEGRDVGDRQTLLTIAGENGLDPSKVKGLLAGDLITAEVGPSKRWPGATMSAVCPSSSSTADGQTASPVRSRPTCCGRRWRQQRPVSELGRASEW